MINRSASCSSAARSGMARTSVTCVGASKRFEGGALKGQFVCLIERLDQFVMREIPTTSLTPLMCVYP